jgi:hypothetical protein
VLAVLLSLLALTPPTRTFADERVLLDRRLEALRRLLPDGPTTTADVSSTRELAQTSGLTQAAFEERAPAEAGASGDSVVRMTALGGFEEIHRFFQKVALSPRLVDVETLTLTATLEGVSQLDTVLRFPYWPSRAPVPAAPETAKFNGVARPALDAFRRDAALAYAKSEAVAARRRSRRTPRLFLAELGAATRQRPVMLGFASLGEEFTLRGIVLGEGPLRVFERRLERGFFRMRDFLIARQGACYRFEAHGQSPVVGPDAELPLPVDDPFEQDASPCRVDRDGAKATTIRGRAPTAKDPGKGPLTLRLRDVDLADLFQALARLGFGGYVVGDAVAGRISVELTRGTLEETLNALRKTAALEVTEMGPVRRISAGGTGGRREVPTGGPLTSFALKRADVRDLVAAMAEVDPALASLGPPGFLGRVSVFTRDVPLFALRAAILDTVSLSERTEEDRRVLERTTGAGEAVMPVARSGPEPRLLLRREEVTVQELELVGVGSAGEGFLAFAYAPTGQLHAYAAGDRLSDAIVRSVDTDGMTLETDEGPLRLSLPLLAN